MVGPVLNTVAFVVAGLLAGPPADPTGESVLYQDEPTPEVETVEPEPPPVEPEPPPPEPPPAIAPPKLELPPPPPPPTGAGRLVGGSFAIALGLGAAAAMIVETSRENGNPQFAAATFIPIGLTSIGVGTYLMVRGAKARGNYNEWRAFTQREALPSGDGLIVAGTMTTLIGGVTLVAAAVQAGRDPNAFTRPLTPSLFAIGGTGLALGVGTLAWGLLRRSKYINWRQATFLGNLTPTVTPVLDPSGAFALRGASFGVQAHFVFTPGVPG
jgi:hypothetical protein